MAPDVFVCSLNSFQPIWNTSWQFAWHKSEILLVAGSRSHPIDDDPQLASLSRVLDLRREGPMISSILSSISPFSPSRNSCRMHHDLRRFFGSRLLHTEDGGLQLHEKIPKFPPLSGSVFWGQHPSQRPGKPCPTPTNYPSHFITCKTTPLRHHRNGPMDKKIHTLLTTLFFQVDDNLAFRDLGLRLRLVPDPSHTRWSYKKRITESGRLLTRHMTVNGILYSRTSQSQTTVRCAVPHPWMGCILTAGYCRLVNFLIIPLSSLSNCSVFRLIEMPCLGSFCSFTRWLI